MKDQERLLKSGDRLVQKIKTMQPCSNDIDRYKYDHIYAYELCFVESGIEKRL